MSKRIITVFTIIVLIGFVIYFYVTCKPIPVKNKTETGIEQIKASNHEKYEIVKHKYFMLAYSEEHEQPAWVCYSLRKDQVGGDEPRSTNFIPDPMVSTQTADDIDYAKSGYDKGHMVPAADMSWSAEAMKETFYFSNMSPQVPSFNRGAWKKLEEKVRSWAVKFDSVKVFVGPVFKDNIKKIGPDSVTVPGYYYKTIVIYYQSNYQGIGFIFPNRKVTDPLVNYAVSIDNVEKYVDIDFYKYLPDADEEKMESNINLELWGLGKTK